MCVSFRCPAKKPEPKRGDSEKCVLPSGVRLKIPEPKRGDSEKCVLPSGVRLKNRATKGELPKNVCCLPVSG